jgi:outer membrane protein assembly factor BamB
MNGKLYTIVRHNPGTEKEAEKVVCVDAATGETKWESIFNVFLTDVPDTRVGWSSVVGDPVTGHVFALGVCGYFQCLDGETGKTLWSVRLGTTVQGYPNSFSIDGKQYIAVTTGLGGGSPEDKPMTMLQGVHRPNNGQALYVFALPDSK